MKFNFKIQEYQTDAVESVVEIFNGQGAGNMHKYIRDLGRVERPAEVQQDPTSLFSISELESNTADEYGEVINLEDSYGFKNDIVKLSDQLLLRNINTMQERNNIKLSEKLIKNLGCCSLDVEMETGTGKTYVYIKTMFELNKRYGWSKFIVVVPSIAIREGVKKSFEITEEHFMQHYGKKARYFVYNSSDLTKIDTFSSSATINVMIINTQAFAASLKEGAKNRESRIIYSERDDFQSRRPIDVIKANRPIIILDEPQKMGGDVTQNALKNFNPLFTLNYSATHTKKNNMVYVLDALDAYNKKLVKKIEVKGIELKNLTGTNKYLYLENIVLSSKEPPAARIEMEIKYQNSINREIRILKKGDNLYVASNEMEQYKGYEISEIDPISGNVKFTNGETIKRGDVVGDANDSDTRRIQIRETIISHLEKEERLFNMGIKTLSLFFIDEVAKYRVYDESGEEQLGEYGQIFEQEYNNIVSNYTSLFNKPYKEYLQKNKISDIHKGYFSIDKSGRSVDSTIKRGLDFSDDISAYDLILKNKERLLSFDEPTRFIFSHSALREGWDNPNVFQICTLKNSGSSTVKRQEVGRGLRLSVNQSGSRMDEESCGDDVQNINLLTVIASVSYSKFIGELQQDISKDLYDRPAIASIAYFEGKKIKFGDEVVDIDNLRASSIFDYLKDSKYIDNSGKILELYRTDKELGTLKELPEDLRPVADGVFKLIDSIFDESVLRNMFVDGNETKIQENKLNDNFHKEEFKTLWNYINHKYAYTVSFDSDELITKSIAHIEKYLNVTRLLYTTTVGSQQSNVTQEQMESRTAFKTTDVRTERLEHATTSQIKYDLIGKIAEGTTLTRRSVTKILQGLDNVKLTMFKENPEEFISKVIKLIKEQKATMIVEKITYNTIDGNYDSEIFTAQKSSQTIHKTYKAKKHIQDYVFTDGLAENSVEKRFAKDLDNANEVCVYAKLPKGFAIPTPLGNYSPDWAIAFNEGRVKHIYFVAETKGTMDSLELRPIEQAKIECAKKLFNELSTSKVRYHEVDSYENLLAVMDSIK